MSNSSDFIIEDGVLKKYVGNASDVIIPDGVIGIGDRAFENCSSIINITIPEGVLSIGVCPFSGCSNLTSIVIPNSVTNISVGRYARFARFHSRVFDGCGSLRDVTIPTHFAKEFYDLFGNLTYKPNLIIHISDITGVDNKYRPLCAAGFAEDNRSINDENGKKYAKYIKSNAVKIINTAMNHPALFNLMLREKLISTKDLKVVTNAVQESGNAQYIAAMLEYANNDISEKEDFRPNLSIKKPSEQKKVELLEETVLRGTLQDIEAVLDTYKTFEFTARALGYAARYRGTEFVKLLMKHDISFKFEGSKILDRKYNCGNDFYNTVGYYYMVITDIQSFDEKVAYCVNPLPKEERICVARFIVKNYKKLGIEEYELSNILLRSLEEGDVEFVDALTDMGIELDEFEISLHGLEDLNDLQLFPILTRIDGFAKKNGIKLGISQAQFDKIKWNDESLEFILSNADLTKVNHKKALEKVISDGSISKLEIMARGGWMDTARKIEDLISYASNNNCVESLAWLMDYKSKNVDAAAEAIKQEKKMLGELTKTDDPNSVSVLKKVWSYKKLEDGTLMITSYKGSETEIEVPAAIGKAKVTVIGRNSFSASSEARNKNESRKLIEKITVSEGIVEIGSEAFCECESLSELVLPSSIKKVGHDAFKGCSKLYDKAGRFVFNNVFWDFDYHLSKGKKLVVPDGVTRIANYAIADLPFPYPIIKQVVLPESLEEIGERSFSHCHLNQVNIPAKVKVINDEAFYSGGLSKLELSEGLEVIGVSAFSYNYIKELTLPKTVKTIGDGAFHGCEYLKDIYISATTKNFGESVFGYTDEEWESLGSFEREHFKENRPKGVILHTPSDSAAEQYAKQYSGITVINDYPEE